MNFLGKTKTVGENRTAYGAIIFLLVMSLLVLGYVPENTVLAEESRGVQVAVLDTGYDVESYGRRRIVKETNYVDTETIQDQNGHGTAMINIILEHTADSIDVMPVKVADVNGEATVQALCKGIYYAIEHKADVIQISMVAGETSDSKMVEEAIGKAKEAGIFVVVSAGNANGDVEKYSPANVEDAIVVTAVNGDHSRMEYSNYGDTVDYCSYGKLEISGLHRKKQHITGTSVASAIVSASVAEEIGTKGKCDYEEMQKRLHARALDLGVKGRDSFFGEGLLVAANVTGGMETREIAASKLLNCDWKKMSDVVFNEIIWGAPDYEKRIFLDQLSDAEKQELWKRNTVFTRNITTVKYRETADGYTEEYREVRPLREYLYSAMFEQYKIQYYLYHYGPAKIYLNTNLDNKKAVVTLEFKDKTTENGNKGELILHGESKGAIDLTKATVGTYSKDEKFLLGSDDNGNTNIIFGIKLDGIVVSKPSHSKVTGWNTLWTANVSESEINWWKRFPGGYSGAKWGYLKAGNCAKESVTESIMFGQGDFEMSEDGKPVTYMLNISKYDSTWGEWGAWNITREPGCTQMGIRERRKIAVCKECKAVVDEEKKTEDIPQLSHVFVEMQDASNGILEGVQWEECCRQCGGYDKNGEFWRKNVRYMHKIYVRFMNTDGSYPGYTVTEVLGYYPEHTLVPGYQYPENETSEFLSGGVKPYESKSAMELYVDIPRKQYRVVYDGNGADKGSLSEQRVYCGQSFLLRRNTFKREGYRFLGWGLQRNGKTLYKEQEKVMNLTYKNEEEIILFAQWEPLYKIEFLNNISEEELKIIENDERGNYIDTPILVPKTKWKEKGKPLTLQLERAEVKHPFFREIYRFKGWSLTPEISGEEEIILSEEQNEYILSEDADCTLYAQWDTSFSVAYIGNGQSEGEDYLEEVKQITKGYRFASNAKEQLSEENVQTADYFIKYMEKQTIDIATGESMHPAGEPYQERVPYRFLGWSMEWEQKKQREQKVYRWEDFEYESHRILLDAGKDRLSFGLPAENYGTFSETDTEKVLSEVPKKPFLNMYAVWDQYPQILACDIYVPLHYAREGRLTEEYLLQCATAVDEEEKEEGNPKGELKPGIDSENKTKFCIPDYQKEDFQGADEDMEVTITYLAEDFVGNRTTKMVTVHLVDTTAKTYEDGRVRFVSAKYAETLSEKSIWRTEEYAVLLSEVLNNTKSGEEYIGVTSLQQAMGAKSVKKPGSGTWSRVNQVWKFTHEEVLEVQKFLDTYGMIGSQNAFLDRFRYCRIK